MLEIKSAQTHKEKVDSKSLISEISVVPFNVLPHAPMRRSVKCGMPAMALSPSGSLSQKPATVANVCCWLLESGRPVFSLLRLTSRNGPRVPWARPMYLHEGCDVSMLRFCAMVCYATGSQPTRSTGEARPGEPLG